jgi:hypothetical protein
MEDMTISRCGIVVAEPSLRELPGRQLTPQRCEFAGARHGGKHICARLVLAE